MRNIARNSATFGETSSFYFSNPQEIAAKSKKGCCPLQQKKPYAWEDGIGNGIYIPDFLYKINIQMRFTLLQGKGEIGHQMDDNANFISILFYGCISKCY